MHDYTVPLYKTVLERVADFPATRLELNSAQEAAEFIFPYLKNKPQEELLAIFLDVHNKVIGVQIITIGRPFSSDVYIPSILTPALLCGALKIIIAHNHPMGDASDISELDERLTMTLLLACENMGIALNDSIIVDDDGAFSSIIAHIRCEGHVCEYTLDEGHQS